MLRKIFLIIETLINKTSTLFVIIAGIELVLMVFIATYGVVMRYFFRMPEPVSYELGTIFLLWTFIFALAEVEKDDEHITSDIFIQFMPDRISKFLRKIITPALGILFCTVLTWKGWSVAMFSLKINERSTSILAEPIFPVKIMIPICYALVVLVLIVKLFRNIMSYVTHEEDKGI